MINSDISQTTRSTFNFKSSTERNYEPQYGEFGEELFRAGQLVDAGTYIEVDGFRQITLEQAGVLPASLDGRRALYRRYERPWMTMSNRSEFVHK